MWRSPTTESTRSRLRAPSGCRPWADYGVLMHSAGFEMKAHEHAFLQLIHVLDGELEVEKGNGWEALRQGDVHVLPPRRVHALRSPRGYAQFGVNFSFEPDERSAFFFIGRAMALMFFTRSARDYTTPARKANSSGISALEPATNPPAAPPSALPKVVVIKSTRPITPQCS